MTDFEIFGLQPYSLEPTKSKVPVGYGKYSMSDLANSSNAATNDEDGSIGNKTWCKCGCCAPMETSIESVCCLEISEICKLRSSVTLCLHVCRSYDIHILFHDILWEKNPLTIWFPHTFDPCQIRTKVLFRFKLHRISLNILLC